jgi:hypothetical protein
MSRRGESIVRPFEDLGVGGAIILVLEWIFKKRV